MLAASAIAILLGLRAELADVADMICSKAFLMSCRFFCVDVEHVFSQQVDEWFSDWFLAVVFLSIKAPLGDLESERRRSSI